MGRKTPNSFNLWKYVEKHWNGRCECTTKHKNNLSYSTNYIVPALIDFFFFLTMIEKRSKHRLIKEIFIFLLSIVLTKNWFVVSNCWEFPKRLLHFPLKIKVKIAKVLRNSFIKQIFLTETTSVSLFWGVIFSNW